MDAAQNVETKKRTLGYMMTAEIAGKLRSKVDYYQYLDKHSKSLFFFLLDPHPVQCYLPDEGSVNKDFLKDVFAGRKQLLMKKDVNYIHVPHYDEISVKALWPEVKKDPIIMSYFPSVYP